MVWPLQFLAHWAVSCLGIACEDRRVLLSVHNWSEVQQKMQGWCRECLDAWVLKHPPAALFNVNVRNYNSFHVSLDRVLTR